MELIIIAAMTKSGVIGIGGKLPWHLPSEQRFFKHVTLGHTVIMGRKTFESIGHPLQGRDNIVLTSRQAPLHPNVDQVSTLQDALDRCSQESKVFIIGGAGIYRDALEIADTLLLTVIDHPFYGDIHFPHWDRNLFTAVGTTRVLDPVPYTITMYRRSLEV